MSRRRDIPTQDEIQSTFVYQIEGETMTDELNNTSSLLKGMEVEDMIGRDRAGEREEQGIMTTKKS